MSYFMAGLYLLPHEHECSLVPAMERSPSHNRRPIASKGIVS